MKHCSLAKIFFLIRRMSWFRACLDSLKRWRTLWSPSQLVQHTKKNRAVFNYSSQNQGKKLNTVLWKKSWSFPVPKWFCRLRPWIRLLWFLWRDLLMKKTPRVAGAPKWDHSQPMLSKISTVWTVTQYICYHSQPRESVREMVEK